LLIHHSERVLQPITEGPPLADEWLEDDEVVFRQSQREERAASMLHQREAGMDRLEPSTSNSRTRSDGTTVRHSEGENLRSVFDAELMELPTPPPMESSIVSPLISPPQQPAAPSPTPTSPRRVRISQALFRTQPIVSTRSGRISRPPTHLSPEPSKQSYNNKTYFFLHCSLAQAFNAMEDILKDPDTNRLDGVHPMAYASKPTSEDNPRYHEAMVGPHKEEFCEAMRKEIDELTKQRTWEVVDRPKNKTVLPGTWAFKIKRYPDGRVRKYKARFCVRGDRQTDGIDAFDTYAPVVQWSTVRLMMTMSSVLGLKSVQVDYNNAFAQARLKEPVYVEIPRGFLTSNGGVKVLKLHSSLYGLRQAAERWYDKLSRGLTKRGFKQSKIDPCLFFHGKMICLIYVDDCLFFARKESDIHSMIKDLRAEFDLVVEDDVSTYLGIKIKSLEDGRIEMSQPYLIERILDATGMTQCNT
ncbi:MAG: reverse transcriptase domain-containing protein, partial [Gloeomargaritales cyanobacterium]